MVFCRQQDRGDLGFIANFRHEKQENRRSERAVFEPTAVRVFIFIGQEQPQADRDEADADDPLTVSGEMASASHTPTNAETKWFSKVAMKMPETTAFFWEKRAARKRASSCVLSPISAMATPSIEEKNASIRYSTEAGKNKKRCTYRPQGYGQRLRLACLPVVRKMLPP